MAPLGSIRGSSCRLFLRRWQRAGSPEGQAGAGGHGAWGPARVGQEGPLIQVRRNQGEEGEKQLSGMVSKTIKNPCQLEANGFHVGLTDSAGAAQHLAGCLARRWCSQNKSSGPPAAKSPPVTARSLPLPMVVSPGRASVNMLQHQAHAEAQADMPHTHTHTHTHQHTTYTTHTTHTSSTTHTQTTHTTHYTYHAYHTHSTKHTHHHTDTQTPHHTYHGHHTIHRHTTQLAFPCAEEELWNPVELGRPPHPGEGRRTPRPTLHRRDPRGSSMTPTARTSFDGALGIFKELHEH